MKAVILAAALVVFGGALLPGALSAQGGVITSSRGTPTPAPPRSSRPGTPQPQGHPSPTTPPRSAAPPFGWSMDSRPGFRPGRGPVFPVRLPAFGILFVDSYWGASDGFDPAYPPFPPPPPGPPPVDDRPTGGLQLDVDPRQALVYANGWPMGVVESFSGYYQHLELPAGPHLIEIVAPGYEPLIVDVMVTPGRTTTYRGSLNRARN